MIKSKRFLSFLSFLTLTITIVYNLNDNISIYANNKDKLDKFHYVYSTLAYTPDFKTLLKNPFDINILNEDNHYPTYELYIILNTMILIILCTSFLLFSFGKYKRKVIILISTFFLILIHPTITQLLIAFLSLISYPILDAIFSGILLILLFSPLKFFKEYFGAIILKTKGQKEIFIKKISFIEIIISIIALSLIGILSYYWIFGENVLQKYYWLFIILFIYWFSYLIYREIVFIKEKNKIKGFFSDSIYDNIKNIHEK